MLVAYPPSEVKTALGYDSPSALTRAAPSLSTFFLSLLSRFLSFYVSSLASRGCSSYNAMAFS